MDGLKLGTPLIVVYKDDREIITKIIRFFNEIEFFLENKRLQIIATFELGEEVDVPALENCLIYMKSAIEMYQKGEVEEDEYTEENEVRSDAKGFFH